MSTTPALKEEGADGAGELQHRLHGSVRLDGASRGRVLEDGRARQQRRRSLRLPGDHDGRVRCGRRLAGAGDAAVDLHRIDTGRPAGAQPRRDGVQCPPPADAERPRNGAERCQVVRRLRDPGLGLGVGFGGGDDDRVRQPVETAELALQRELPRARMHDLDAHEPLLARRRQQPADLPAGDAESGADLILRLARFVVELRGFHSQDLVGVVQGHTSKPRREHNVCAMDAHVSRRVAALPRTAYRSSSGTGRATTAPAAAAARAVAVRNARARVQAPVSSCRRPTASGPNEPMT